MKKVTKDEFYAVIGPQDVLLRITTDFPYTTEFRARHLGKLVGKTVDSYSKDGGYPIGTEYFLSFTDET